MSKLRQQILEWIRIMGNNSGCHQRADRSFFYKGKQFPVCARCTGVSVGHLAAIISQIIGCPCKSVPICTTLLAAMGADWAIQETGIKESTNRRRFVTGIMGGFGLFSIYFIILKFVLKKIRSFFQKH